MPTEASMALNKRFQLACQSFRHLHAERSAVVKNLDVKRFIPRLSVMIEIIIVTSSKLPISGAVDFVPPPPIPMRLELLTIGERPILLWLLEIGRAHV